MSAAILARIAALEARVADLEAGGGKSTSGGGAAPSGGEALPDHMLDNAWADKTITKDPKQWKGPTQVNKRFSRAPSEWLEMMAKNMDFKAQKGREEVPVRLNNKGKPWHESDTFEAKILRGWAVRNASKPTQDRKPAPAGGNDDFNFGANETADSDIGF